jgi:glycosyltransferase involved in cell wall biosynthesis
MFIMEPIVSVCIPAYNAEHFIRETIESVLDQTYPNLEIIVSDDCSKDRTPEIVSQYSSLGVFLIQNSHNVGMFGNFNQVIRASSGKYILKLDADDLVAPGHITDQVAVLEANPQVTFAHCACRLIDFNGNLIGYERSIHGSFIRSGIEEWPRYVFGPRAVNIVTIRRSAFDQAGGYDERYSYSGDWAMHRALLRLGSVFYNDKVLASYRVHSTGKEGIRLMQAREHLMQLEDIEKDWPEEIGGKEILLKRARSRLGGSVARSAAYSSPKERIEILALLPKYGNNLSIRVLSLIIQMGGSVVIKFHDRSWLTLRQIVKWFLYKRIIKLV